MRKAISLFLAATVLCFSTSAFATIGTSSLSGNVNTGTTSLDTTYTGGNGRSTTMPGFRPGDSISFTITDLSAGEDLTLISYKYGSTPSDTTVQYINQYSVSGTTQGIDYTIRDQASGIYGIVITGSTSGTRTFYYKIGNVTVSMVGSSTPYTIVKYPDGTYSIGFIGKAASDDSNINIAELTNSVGFTLNGGKFNNHNATVSASTLDSYFNGLISSSQLELSGSYAVIYGLTVWKIPEGTQNSITAQAYKSN